MSAPANTERMRDMNHNHGSGNAKHFLLMIACCLIPLALILGVSVLGLSFGSLSGFVPYVIALICPLMMLWMMRQMMRDQGDTAKRPAQTEKAEPVSALEKSR